MPDLRQIDVAGIQTHGGLVVSDGCRMLRMLRSPSGLRTCQTEDQKNTISSCPVPHYPVLWRKVPHLSSSVWVSRGCPSGAPATLVSGGML